MVNVSVTISNIDQIRAAFRKAPTVMAKNLDKAIKKSILAIQRQSMINSPVLTGRMRASHQAVFSPLMGAVGPTVNYAIYVHEGTRYMKARPFLANAVKSLNNNVQDNFKQAVQDTLDTIAKDAG